MRDKVLTEKEAVTQAAQLAAPIFDKQDWHYVGEGWQYYVPDKEKLIEKIEELMTDSDAEWIESGRFRIVNDRGRKHIFLHLSSCGEYDIKEVN